MTKTRRWIARTLVVTAVVMLGAGPATASEEVPLVDGKIESLSNMRAGVQPFQGKSR